MIPADSITGDIALDLLGKVVSARFLIYEVTIFSLILIINF